MKVYEVAYSHMISFLYLRSNPSGAFMLTIDQKIQVLNHLLPNCERAIDGDTLIWLDSRTQPTDAEMEAAWYNINLTEVKAHQEILITRWRDEALALGFEWTFNGTTPDMMPITFTAQTNILGIVLRAFLLQDDPNATIRTRAMSNTDYWMSIAETKQMGVAIYEHIETIYLHAWGLSDQVQAATTPEDVKAVQWTLVL